MNDHLQGSNIKATMIQTEFYKQSYKHTPTYRHKLYFCCHQSTTGHHLQPDI